ALQKLSRGLFGAVPRGRANVSELSRRAPRTHSRAPSRRAAGTRGPVCRIRRDAPREFGTLAARHSVQTRVVESKGAARAAHARLYSNVSCGRERVRHVASANGF